MFDTQMEPSIARDMIKGAADPLVSAFQLRYSQLLQLARTEGTTPEMLLQVRSCRVSNGPVYWLACRGYSTVHRIAWLSCTIEYVFSIQNHVDMLCMPCVPLLACVCKQWSCFLAGSCRPASGSGSCATTSPSLKLGQHSLLLRGMQSQWHRKTRYAVG